MRTHVTKDRVLELLDVDVDAGKLHRRVGVRGHAAGEEAGTAMGTHGYRRVRIDQRSYDVHQIIWLVAHGSWPERIDHINGIKTDNRISNLRLVTVRENAQNRTVPRRGSKSGVLGAHWNARRRKWKSEISVDGKRVHLGSFGTAEAAHAAYMAAKRRLHPGFAR
jgi:hypothetical protein